MSAPSPELVEVFAARQKRLKVAQTRLRAAEREVAQAVRDLTVITKSNGVTTKVTYFEDGTTVDATCSCFGSSFRAHNNPGCPNRQANGFAS